MTHTFVYILIDTFAVPYLRGRKWVDCVAEICHSGLAHPLLMGNRHDRKFSGVLLGNGKRGLLCLLSVCFAIDTVPIGSMAVRASDAWCSNSSETVPDCPWRYPFQLELSSL